MDSTAEFAQLPLRLGDQLQWRYEVIRPLVLFADRTAPQPNPANTLSLFRTFGECFAALPAMGDTIVGGAFGDSYASRRRRRCRSNTRSYVPLSLAQRCANISLLLASYHQAPERLRRA